MEGETILVPGFFLGLWALFEALKPYLDQSEAERRADSDDDQMQ